MAPARPSTRAVQPDGQRVEDLVDGESREDVGAAVAAGVPKFPSRSSVAPVRKKFRQVPFSAP